MTHNPNLDLLVQDLKEIVHHSLLHYVDRATRGEGYLAKLPTSTLTTIIPEVASYLEEEELGIVDDRLVTIIGLWGRIYFVENDRPDQPIPLIWCSGVSNYDKVNQMMSRVRFALQDDEVNLRHTYQINLGYAIRLLPRAAAGGTVASVRGWPYIKHTQSTRRLGKRLKRLRNLIHHTTVIEDLDVVMSTDQSLPTVGIYNVLLALRGNDDIWSQEYILTANSFNHRKLCKMLTKLTGKKYNV